MNKIIATSGRIEGFVNYGGADQFSVVAFSKHRGRWTTAHSMCLPSDSSDALIITDCMAGAARVLGEYLTPDCSKCRFDGGQSVFPSGCTGCSAYIDYDNFEIKGYDK